MLRKLGHLFTIKTRWEAWLVIYAIAVGAVERGQHYMATYPGSTGTLLALACTGVVFLAGAKLLDAVRPPPPGVAAGPYPAVVKRRAPIGRNRPTRQRLNPYSESRLSRRTD